MHNKICIVIISYNKVNPVIRAVKSSIQSYPDAEIILIDNSEDIKFFKELKQKLKNYSNIEFIKNNINVGFSKGVNQGIRIALEKNTEYILLINDDVYVDKDCIPQLVDVLEKNEKALLAGPTIFYDKYPNKIWHTGGYFNKLLGNINIPYKNKTMNPDFFKILSPKEVDFLTGCVLMIKRKAFKIIGFFDETFFFYGEDLDYSLRVKKSGYKLLWVPYAFAWHDIDIEKERTNPFVMYHLGRSNVYVRKKHFNKIYFFYYLFLHFTLYTIFRSYQIFKGSKNIASLKAWIKGSWDGLLI